MQKIKQLNQQQLKVGPLISIAQAAARLGLKPVTVRMWVDHRKMSSVRLGRRILVPESEVDRLITEGYRPAKNNP